MVHLRISVNGVETEVPPGTSVSRLLEIVQESRTSDMIVEINHRFVHAEAYDRTMLKEGDRMEIIHLAMGG